MACHSWVQCKRSTNKNMFSIYCVTGWIFTNLMYDWWCCTLLCTNCHKTELTNTKVIISESSDEYSRYTVKINFTGCTIQSSAEYKQFIYMVSHYMFLYWGMFNALRSFLYSSSKRHKFVLTVKQSLSVFIRKLMKQQLLFPIK